MDKKNDPVYKENPNTAFWENRSRYELTPQRYSEVSSKPSIKKIFKLMGNAWRKNRDLIKYVDLGSGDCRGTRKFADFLGTTTGISIESTAVDASNKCKIQCEKQKINFLQLDLNSQSIPIQDVQIFTLFETIEHIFNTDNLLSSIRQAISKDGLLLVTTLNVVCWKNRILVPLGIQPFNTEVSTKKLSYGFKSKFLKQKMDVWKPAGHIRPFTLYSLRDILADNGFSVIGSFGLENWRAFKFLEHLAKNMCTGILVVAAPS